MISNLNHDLSWLKQQQGFSTFWIILIKLNSDSSAIIIKVAISFKLQPVSKVWEKVILNDGQN